MRIKSHLATQHTNNPPTPSPAHTPQNSSVEPNTALACPLCQEPFAEKSRIQKHLTSVHNVNSEGLQKLLALVEDPKVKMPPTTTADLPLPSTTLKHAKDMEVDLEALEVEYARLAAEDGKFS